jgi:hypothetical protein
MEPQAASKLADGLAAAAVAAIPWSTSIAYILIAAWAIVFLPNSDPLAWRAVMRHPAAYLPVALAALAAIGMVWAFGVPWGQRLEGLVSFGKLLAIPILFVQFRNSPRAHWVLLAFLVSCSALLALSWFQVVTGLKPLPRGGSTSYGVPVRDYIVQSQEFILCTVGLIYLAFMTIRQRRWPLTLGCAALALLFLANVFFIAPSRTGLVTFPLLLVILVAAHMRLSYTLGIACAVVATCAVVWLASPAIQKRILGIITEVQDARSKHISTSAGERLEYWTSSLGIVKTAPAIGHGTGSIRLMFERAAAETDSKKRPTTNPHNQTLMVAIQLGIAGTALLFGMWFSHFILFRVGGLAGWVGMAVVAQNFIGSLFNNHLTDFTQSWIYIFGVGVAGALALKAPQGHDDFGSYRSKIINVIDSDNLENDVVRKPLRTFRHRASSEFAT